MPANIEQSGELAAFVSHRELPWHRLGTTTQDVLTAESALELAHLNGWDVRKNPMTITVNGKEIKVPNRYAIIRNNPFENKVDVLGVGGSKYTPVQNEEHVDFLNALAEHNEFETAGSLNGGREVFVSMKKPQHLLVGGVDAVDMYIMAHNSHDGTKAFSVRTTPVRVVCKNTLAAAFRDYRRVLSFRHTSGAMGGAVARAREALDLSFKYEAEFEQEAEKMIQETLTNRKFDQIVKRLFPVKDNASDLVKGRVMDIRSDLRSLYESSPTAATIRGTNWAGYQAVTEYMDHFTNVPGKSEEAAAIRRAEKIMDGKLDRKKEVAFNLFQVA